ncbi:MAG: sigma-70 family RNA polymerase sigma factor [Bacteroidales bacterium]|nr:sigma-70 family RNA polymerase sigma factor [Bacteroidales bacterium]
MKNLVKMTDEQLVAIFAKGENTAFDILLTRHKTKIYSYIFYTVRDRDLAEDIFQDTFMKAIVTIKQGRYSENGKFTAWITRIAHNLIIDFFRQDKDDVSTSCEDNGVLNSTKFSEGTIEDELIQMQIRTDVRRIIRQLPANQREVLIMRYYKNLSFKEISDLTGVSINTALGRMRYALINMRRIAQENNVILTMD